MPRSLLAVLLGTMRLAACSDEDAGPPGTRVDAGGPVRPDAGRLEDEGPVTNTRELFAGGALPGTLRVRAFDAATGAPLAGATVVAGAELAVTGTDGSVERAVATSAVTVTVTAPCHAPRTFVDVPVVRVAAYLDPVRDVACAGDPQDYPSLGVAPGTVTGALVFPPDLPLPARAGERRAAYVFAPSPDAAGAFALPPASAAANGSAFRIDVAPGNVTLYAFVGIEDRSRASFVPYAMGVIRGLVVASATRVESRITLDARIDRTLKVAAAAPGRFTATASVSLGAAGFALLPLARASAVSPAAAELLVPSLEGSLAGARYLVGARTETSVVAPEPTLAGAITVDDILPPPVLEAPGTLWSGTNVAFAGAAADLSLVTITAGARTWSIVAPGGRASFALSSAVLPAGTFHATVYTARIPGFRYAALRADDLGTARWSHWAHATRDGLR